MNSIKGNTKVTRAVELYESFRGAPPEHIDTIEVPDYDVIIVIGYLDLVGYHTYRDSEDQYYVHNFGKRNRPLLCSSYDGKQLYIIGGRYKFTHRGIIG